MGAIGWYGKLPSAGDFLGRRLPPEFQGPWDRWLQHGLRIRITESVIPDRDHHGFSVDTPDDLARAEQMYLDKAAR